MTDAKKQRTPICLKGADKYKLMRWVDEHRDVCLRMTDEMAAELAALDTEVAQINGNHIANARREFGLTKEPVKIPSRNNQFGAWSFAIATLAAICADLAERTGNPLLAKEARRLAEEQK